MPLHSAQSPLPIQRQGANTNSPASYRTALNHTGAAGVVAEIRGSASTTVFITKIGLTLGASDTITIDFRSANSSGGTSAGLTETPLDSNNPAATATVLQFTAAPAPGALVGALTAFTGTEVAYAYGTADSAQPLTLRGTAETITITLAAGTTITGFIEWYEA